MRTYYFPFVTIIYMVSFYLLLGDKSPFMLGLGEDAITIGLLYVTIVFSLLQVVVGGTYWAMDARKMIRARNLMRVHIYVTSICILSVLTLHYFRLQKNLFGKEGEGIYTFLNEALVNHWQVYGLIGAAVIQLLFPINILRSRAYY